MNFIIKLSFLSEYWKLLFLQTLPHEKNIAPHLHIRLVEKVGMMSEEKRILGSYTSDEHILSDCFIKKDAEGLKDEYSKEEKFLSEERKEKSKKLST